MKISLKLFLGTVLVFWNVENFFDYRTESTLSGKNWTAGRFYSKARGVGKVLLELAEEKGEAPMVVGLAEIDSPKTLKAIVYGLSKVFVMQFFMALHLADIVTIQQPVDLLTGQA